MRLVLALDTATSECAIGVGLWPLEPDGEPALLGETNVSTPRAALTHVVPMIVRLLEDCERDVGDIGAVVVGRGPGSFTGVRIGIATAQGLAQGLGVPLYGVGTLDAVAERFAGRDGLVGVVGDAMRREVYPALFRCSDGVVERLTSDTVCRPQEVASRWAKELEEPVLLAGEGLHKYVELFVDALGARAEVSPAASWTPTGSSLLGAAWRSRAARPAGGAGAVLPIYTRLSDAEENEKADGERSGRLPDSGVAGPSAGGTP